MNKRRYEIEFFLKLIIPYHSDMLRETVLDVETSIVYRSMIVIRFGKWDVE